MAKYTISDDEIIDVLRRTGHLDMPFGELQEVPDGQLTLLNPAVKRAVASYQSFNAPAMAPMIATLYGDSRASAAVRPDGVVGPATRHLFQMPRCACPDYDPAFDSSVSAAQGNGNWRGCWDVGDYHSVKIRFTNDPPEFLKPYWQKILDGVQRAYAEVGLLIQWVDSGFANITSTFRSLGGSTIGLAQVVNGASCNTTQWADFNPGFRPGDVINQWISLLMHEYCHSSGIGHQSSGHMSPTIQSGLAPTWQGDVTWRLLASRFGGKAVQIPGDEDPGERVMVVGYEYPGGRFEKLYELPKGDGFWPGG